MSGVFFRCSLLCLMILDETANVERVEQCKKEGTFVLPSTSVRPFFLALIIEEGFVGPREVATGMKYVEKNNIDELRERVLLEAFDTEWTRHTISAASKTWE